MLLLLLWMPTILDKKPEILSLFAAGWSCSAIARKLGVQTSAVTLFLQRQGVRVRLIGPKKLTADKREEIAAEYARGVGTKELTTRFGIHEATVRYIVKTSGGKLRAQGDHSQVLSDQEIKAAIEMFGRGVNLKEIGKRLGRFDRIVSAHLKRAGFTMGPRGREAKSGRWMTPHGYWQVRPDVDDAIAMSMLNASGDVLEHRLVMARHLGRPLSRKETVHHINGDKSDNRIENLQLRQGKHGKHECFQCQDCGSVNVKAVPIADAAPVKAA